MSVSPPRGVSPLVGRWLNTQQGTHGILVLELSGAGPESRLRTWLSGGGVVDWEVEPSGYPGLAGGPELAFTAKREFDGYQGRLQGCLNLNLLVLGTYRHLPERGIGYFSREFYALSAAPPPRPPVVASAAAAELFGTITQEPQVSLDALLNE